MENFIVFSGGGCNGALFIGAWFRYLYSRLYTNPGWKPKGVCGTSIGALMAFFVIMGESIRGIVNMFKRNVSIFKSPKSLTSVIDDGELFDITEIRKTLQTYIITKLGRAKITFQELYEKTAIQFIVCACNISNLTRKLFSASETPHVDVVDALLASMCIPVVFRPQLIDDELFVDGGILCNLVVDIFPKRETVFFWIHPPPSFISPDVLLNSNTDLLKQVFRGIYHSSDEIFYKSCIKGRLFILKPLVDLLETHDDISWENISLQGAMMTCKISEDIFGLFLVMILLSNQLDIT